MKKQFPMATIGGIAGLVIAYLIFGKLPDGYINPLSLILIGKPESIFGIGTYMVLYETRKRILIYGAVGLAGGFVVDLIRHASQSGGEHPLTQPATVGATTGGSRRPVGVTVIASLLLLGAIAEMLLLATVSANNAIILGVCVPVDVMRWFHSLGIAASLYCGAGLLRRKKLARTLYVWFAGFGIANTILTSISLARHAPESALLSFLVAILVAVTFYVWAISQMIRHRDLFVN